MFGGNFAPAGWAFCAGQLLPISQNDILFNLIGTTYGGDGQSTFGLPDLQGRLPLHQGTLGGITYQIGEKAGSESVTLTTNQLPIHNHSVLANSNIGQNPQPDGSILAQSQGIQVFLSDSPVQNTGATLTPVGGSQPHENMMPYLCVSFIISLFGVFPTQN
jgi:microcystin-dependent protein